MLPLPIIVIGGSVGIGVSANGLLVLFGGVTLLLAALIPGPADESWGSMAPLVGYDNAIDSLYVRGPWWQRFAELDELEAEKRLTAAMSEWF